MRWHLSKSILVIIISSCSQERIVLRRWWHRVPTCQLIRASSQGIDSRRYKDLDLFLVILTDKSLSDSNRYSSRRVMDDSNGLTNLLSVHQASEHRLTVRDTRWIHRVFIWVRLSHSSHRTIRPLSLGRRTTLSDGFARWISRSSLINSANKTVLMV